MHEKKYTLRRMSTNTSSMTADSFETLCETKFKLQLPELCHMAHNSAPFHVTTKQEGIIYDLIF